MRSTNEPTELSYVSFIETYGRVNGDYHQHRKSSAENEIASDLPKINVTKGKEENHITMTKKEELKDQSEDNGSRKGSLGIVSFGSSYDSSSDNALSTKVRGKRQKFRKISVEKLSSLGGAIQAAVTSKRSKTNSFSDKNGLPQMKYDRKSWIPGTSHFSRKLSDDSTSLSTEENENCSVKSEENLIDTIRVPNPHSIPGSRVGTYAHRGYLDCRNRKKHWERYWCVLQDACLYCYHSPQSDVTRDVILLRGYDVIADVTNLKRSRYMFRLQQQGFPTLHFSSDNHRDYLLWVGTLERETRCVFSRNFSNSDNSSPPKTLSSSDKSSDLSASSLSLETRNLQVDSELLKLQKQRLFKELALQKEQLMEEQTILEKLDSPTSGTSGPITNKRKMTKEQILNQYEKERQRQELKSKASLVLLTRRRNSYHLKMNQYTKALAPGVGQRNKENHIRLSAIEKKLKEMQESLALIDRELEEEEALKQHNVERLECKRDLELMVADQQDAIDIVKKYQSEKDALQSSRSGTTPSSLKSHDTLGSIDELSDDLVTLSIASTSSDGNFCGNCRVSSSSSSCSPDAAPYPRYILRSISDPCGNDYAVEVDGMEPHRSSDEDSGFQVSVGAKADDSYEFYQSVIQSFFPSPVKKINDTGDPNFDFPDDFTDFTSKDSTLKAAPLSLQPEKVDSAILAKIEDFELFAKLKLEEAKKT